MNHIIFTGLKKNIQRKFISHKKKLAPEFEKLLIKICDYLNVNIHHVLSETRTKREIEAKHIWFYIMKKHTEFSWVKIAKITGYHHSSIIHAFNKLTNFIETYPDYRLRIETIETTIISESRFDY